MKQIIILLTLLTLLLSVATSTTYAQTGVGAPVLNAKAALDTQASDKGLLIDFTSSGNTFTLPYWGFRAYGLSAGRTEGLTSSTSSNQQFPCNFDFLVCRP